MKQYKSDKNKETASVDQDDQSQGTEDDLYKRWREVVNAYE